MSDLISRQAALDLLTEVEEIHPYKVPGDLWSYSEYTEGWTDAVIAIEARLQTIPAAEKPPTMDRLKEVFREIRKEK